MSRITTLEARVQIQTLAGAGLPDRQIAATIGSSLATVRKWRRRAAAQGRAGLAVPLGRPPTGGLAGFAPQMRTAVLAWRQAHPGWGPKTLHAELARDPACAGLRLPSRATLARFLQAQGLTRRYDRHTSLPRPPARPVTAPHQEWQLDARGAERVAGVGVITLIDLVDCASHVRLLSYPCCLGQTRADHSPTTEDYQVALRLAFTQWGLPDRIAVDHDPLFADPNSASPYPTRLHLWLEALGVRLVFARRGRPTDQGSVERSHELWFQQVLRGVTFTGWSALVAALDARRDFLNGALPCASLGEVPPLVAHPDAATPRRPYRPEWEATLLDLDHLRRYLGQGQWFRRVSKVGTVSLGHHVYSVGRAWARHQVEIRVDATAQQVVIVAGSGAEITRRPLQGVTPVALMGAFGAFHRLPAIQLTLPFAGAPPVIRLCETLGV